jgi:hypothetical protein
MTLIYVYAILPGDVELPADLHGFHEAPLELVHVKDLAAVVTTQPDESPSPTPERVMAHHSVVSRLRHTRPALPVRFGTVLQHDALVNTLINQHDRLTSDIVRLAGKVEYGITALWGSLLERMPKSVAPELKTAESGTSYMRQRLAEYQQEKQLIKLAESIGSDMKHCLEGCTEDAAISVLPTPKIPVRGKFLVDSQCGGDFESAYLELCRERTDLRFSLVGPWPPYSFVTTGDDFALGTRDAN